MQNLFGKLDKQMVASGQEPISARYPGLVPTKKAGPGVAPVANPLAIPTRGTRSTFNPLGY
jgi:hypothetical protein